MKGSLKKEKEDLEDFPISSPENFQHVAHVDRDFAVRVEKGFRVEDLPDEYLYLFLSWNNQ